MDTPNLPQLRAALARTTKRHGPFALATLEARRDYEAAKLTAELAERLTLGALPFTPSQLETLETLVAEAQRRAYQGAAS